jgi:hypothetical protein
MEFVIGGVLYFILLVTLGIITIRKGHWVMFIIGIFIPLFWIIGALMPRGSPPSCKSGCRAGRKRASRFGSAHTAQGRHRPHPRNDRGRFDGRMAGDGRMSEELAPPGVLPVAQPPVLLSSRKNIG